MLKRICNVIEDKKGTDILILDISKVSSFSDFFVICHGENLRQNRAICDALKEILKREEGVVPSHIEGYDTADWILMDYLDCVVHVFSSEARSYYKLERLWSDAKELTPQTLIA
jgi:ribosome-associated protein